MFAVQSSGPETLPRTQERSWARCCVLASQCCGGRDGSFPWVSVATESNLFCEFQTNERHWLKKQIDGFRGTISAVDLQPAYTRVYPHKHATTGTYKDFKNRRDGPELKQNEELSKGSSRSGLLSDMKASHRNDLTGGTPLLYTEATVGARFCRLPL